jgi:hypothetical protein
MKDKPKYFTVEITNRSNSKTYLLKGGPYDNSHGDILWTSIRDFTNKNDIDPGQCNMAIKSVDKDPLLPSN